MEEEMALNTVGFDVTPINNNCSMQQKTVILSNSDDPGSQTNQQIDSTSAQAKNDSAFDTIDTESLKPLYGGKLNQYEIIYKNKIFIVRTHEINNIIKHLVKELKIKKDALFEVNQIKKIKKNKNIYSNTHIYHYKNNKRPVILKVR